MTFETQQIVAALVAFVISITLTPIIRDLAIKNALLDIPNHRSSHVVPVPRLGGMAIAVAALTGAIIAADYIGGWISIVGLAAILLVVLGFWDDAKTIGPFTKYGVQIVSAILAVAALEPRFLISLPSTDFELPRILGYVIAVVWITAFVNAYNFIDGVDGLSSGVGIVLIIGLVTLGSGFGSFFLLPLAGALLGFLTWNMNPATIFMGDSGSQFVGFALAVGALGPRGQLVHAVPVILLFSPILFDTGLTLTRRAIQGKNIFTGHNEHYYQRLGRAGVPARAVANIQYLLIAGSALAAVGYAQTEGSRKLLYPFLCLLALGSYAGAVTLLERRSQNRLANATTVINDQMPSSDAT